MTEEPVFIEPSEGNRRGFARWCLAQVPPIQTAGSTGSLVPLDLYPSVPPELLDGAYVDGFPYGGPGMPQEAVQPPAVAPAAPKVAARPRKPLTAEQGAVKRPRKRAAKKAAAPKTGGVSGA